MNYFTLFVAEPASYSFLDSACRKAPDKKGKKEKKRTFVKYLQNRPEPTAKQHLLVCGLTHDSPGIMGKKENVLRNKTKTKLKSRSRKFRQKHI